jgi:hypothetical protein
MQSLYQVAEHPPKPTTDGKGTFSKCPTESQRLKSLGASLIEIVVLQKILFLIGKPSSQGTQSLHVYVTVPTLSDYGFRMNTKLPFIVSEYRKPSLKQQDTMNVRISILKRLKNSAT